MGTTNRHRLPGSHATTKEQQRCVCVCEVCGSVWHVMRGDDAIHRGGDATYSVLVNISLFGVEELNEEFISNVFQFTQSTS